MQTVTHFHGRELPEPGYPAGYAWLIDHYGLRIPLPERLAAIAERHHPKSDARWAMMFPRQRPETTPAGHLQFAIRYEGIDLLVLHALTHAMSDDDLLPALGTTTGIYTRRLWFIWEWLTGRRVPIEDLGKVKYEPMLDPEAYVALRDGERSARHKIIDNLPGTPAFCPLVRRTPKLDALLDRNLADEARGIVARAPADLIARAASFLVLGDSKASYSIEGEQPGPQRTARWARVIAEAGGSDISVAEFERLQRIVIQDARFVRMGLRIEGGFIGRHERDTGLPLPEHISARHEDLRDLLEGLQALEQRGLRHGLDPIALAALLAFGFVYIHPFEDGNGRLHRYVIHHVLARAGFNPKGIVFPVSAAIERKIEGYASVLKQVSQPMLEFIEWKPTPRRNVEVLNETAHLYRYFDATAHAGFLAECVAETVHHDLPEAIAYLEAYDRFGAAVLPYLELPNQKLDLLYKFLEQNGGSLSKRAREREFKLLTPDEVELVERAYAMAFDGASVNVDTGECQIGRS